LAINSLIGERRLLMVGSRASSAPARTGRKLVRYSLAPRWRERPQCRLENEFSSRFASQNRKLKCWNAHQPREVLAVWAFSIYYRRTRQAWPFGRPHFESEPMLLRRFACQAPDDEPH
jgi:hypothetical protein